MKSKIRMYVEALFDNAMKTEEVIELREEILQNVIDKYEDLVSAGKSENEAYSTAVSGIGDINELLRSMGGDKSEKENYSPYNTEAVHTEEKQPKTTLLCTAIVLYILSIIPMVIGDEVSGTSKAEGIGFCITAIICAIATAFIIKYNASKPKNVEENKSKDKDEIKDNPVVDSISSAVWAVATALYFIISFMTGAWYITWVIFIIASAVKEVIAAYFEYKDEKDEGRY